jgi:hypothetical protein
VKNRLFISFLKLFLTFLLWLPTTTATAEMIQPRKLVDAHTAGILGRGEYDFECRIYPAADSSLGAGLTVGIDVGITNRLTIGLSYGGEGIVGRGKNVRFHYLPGWLIKYRIIEERMHFPGIALGYDHQGHGGIADNSKFGYKGYIFQSPGFFISLSKNYLLFSRIQFGIHGMANYSMENYKEVRWPNCIAGLDIGINEELSMVFEYDFGFNILDRSPGVQPLYARPSEGYLNAGIRWAFSPSFYIEFAARDLLEHRRTQNGRWVSWGREIKLVYFSAF